MLLLEQIQTINLAFIALVILVGVLFEKIARRLKIPNVTGYLVGGLLIGPIMKLFHIEIISNEAMAVIDLIPQITLGFIAFTIGSEFRLSYFKRVGTKPLIIAVFESFFAIVAVFIILVILKLIGLIPVSYNFIIILSAIAAATAPAATLMVVKQYQAKGEVTENLMSVVALDDATAIMFFGIMVAISEIITANRQQIVWDLFKPFVEILTSLVIGSIIGLILTLLVKWFKGRGSRISIVIALILFTVSLGEIIKIMVPTFELSTLLTCMMMGAIFTNLTSDEDFNKIMDSIDTVTPPLLVVFFVISGAKLDFFVLTTVGLVGFAYIIFRVIGKLFGAYLGSSIAKSSENVKRYLGWALIPQAGVAIGLTIVADAIIPQYAPQIRAVILSGTLIYELIGPFITKHVLIKAGEIDIKKAH